MFLCILLELLPSGILVSYILLGGGTSLSVGFTVSNGVRQGGILSPLLFNFYMNDLSVVLNKVHAGCCSAGLILNHLMYADDDVFAPSAKGLQKLLDVCTDNGQNHDIIYMNLI